MDFKRRKYHLRMVQPTEVEPVVEFYKGAVVFDHTFDANETGEGRLTVAEAGERARNGEMFVVVPRKLTMGWAAIHAAIILDHDDSAHPNQGFTPENSVHFTRFAVAPERRLIAFGRQVLWPLMTKYAQLHGYDTIYTEICPTAFAESLRGYYERLKMEYQGSTNETDGSAVDRLSISLKK